MNPSMRNLRHLIKKHVPTHRNQIGGMLFILVIWIMFFPWMEQILKGLYTSRPPVISRYSMMDLFIQHLGLSLVPILLATTTAIWLGMFATLKENQELKTLLIHVASLGETIPTVTIIALSVPLIGYGNAPCFIALYAYGILPILRNFIVGVETVDPIVIEAGKGMGLSRWESLIMISIPLAWPSIIAGIRTSIVVAISAATIGATVGAGGFGIPIIAGIRTQDPLLVLQGSTPVILMALIADRLLRR